MALAGPLAHRRPFFGWYLVFLAFQAQLMSWGFYFTLTYFIGPMTADLHWSSTEFSTVQLLNNLSFSVVLPFLGRYLDRYGGRTFMIAGGIIGAFGIASVAWVNQIWQFYLVMGLIVPIAMAMYGSIVAGVALANWFHKKRGRAFALASMGTSAGGVTFGPLASYLIGTIGWRETWLVMAGIVLVGITIPAFLFMSRRPEDVGLLPDGDAPEVTPPPVRGRRAAPAPPPVAVAMWTRAEAVRTPAFWLITLSFAMSNLVIGAFLLHVFPFLVSNGFSSSQATLIAVCFSSVLVLSKPFYGFALERWPARRVSFASFLLSGLMVAAMVVLRQPGFLVVAVMVYGVGMSGSIPNEDVAWANYFGRWAIGSIRGVAYPIESLIGSAGPIIGAVAYDATGGYTGAFAIFAVAYAAASLGILAARPPKWRAGSTLPLPAVAPVRPSAITALATSKTAATVGAVVARAESGVRQTIQEPRVQRGASVLLASGVGLAAGLMVTLLPAPPVRRRTETAEGKQAAPRGPGTPALPARRSPEPSRAPAKRPAGDWAAQTLRGIRRDGQAVSRLARRFAGRR